ncbi:MAG: hypothetical protein HQ530_05490 [Parcubacteria group bacterium]|nr:hypothetical protein [Parcubacteria group bacterium]
MKYAELAENIKAKNWYRQGGEFSFFYSFRPYKSIYKLLGYDNCITTQIGRENIAYFNRDEETKKAREIIKKAEKSRDYIDDKIKQWQALDGQMMDLLQAKFSRPVADWSDQELTDNLKEITKLSLDSWIVALVIEVFDPEGDKILTELVAKEKVELSSEEIAILISPDSPTEQQQELIARVQIAQDYKAGKDTAKQLANHQQKYFWLGSNWHEVARLTIDDFREKIEQDVKKIDQRVGEVDKINKDLQHVAEQKVALQKSKNISQSLQNVFYLFSQMTEWRDVRKKSICIINHYLYQILERLSKVNKIELELLHFLNLWDIKGWQLPAGIAKELKKRQAGIVYGYGPKMGEWYRFYDQEAEKLTNLLAESLRQDDIKGMCASSGVVQGEVRVVLTRDDFSKVKEGDIIVAVMTRPDYLPIMKKAGGIVTDEGGLTCHAAIVARELKIPCLVGVQTATATLKDGDRIKIDADKGSVKKMG